MKHSNADGGRSVRLLRVGEQIRHVVAELLMRGDVHDPVLLDHPVTVSHCKVSPDLRHATLFIEPLGGVDEDAVLQALRGHARFLKGEVGKRVRTKYVPDLVFRLDDSFNEATRIDNLLRSERIRRDLARPPVSIDDDPADS